MDANDGYLEVSHKLVQPNREWRPRELLDAARKAESGWAIGIVFDGSDAAPKPTTEGAIAARIPRWDSPDQHDRWTLTKDGGFYCADLFEEDFGSPQFSSSEGHPDRMLWFDIRIWRMAEALLHSANLYRALGIEPDQPYAFSLRHHGLSGRESYASKPSFEIRRHRISSADRAEWQRILTQDEVKASLRELVQEIADGLFVLFDFMKVSVDSELDGFLSSLPKRV